MTPVCRYGQTWTDWRNVGSSSGGRIERLTLEAGEVVTALAGQSRDSNGFTYYLDVTTSTGRRWQQGQHVEEDWSQHPSPVLGGRLSHLSGRERRGTVLCCHWTCD